MKSIFRYFIVVLGLVLLTPAAFAQLMTNLVVDVRAMSMGNAVTAEPPGISAVHFNPAGLAKLEGRQLQLQFFMLSADGATEYSAPPGYNVFGYSDDPVVCADSGARTDTPDDGVDTCSQFMVTRSEPAGVALYVPVIDRIIKLPRSGGPSPLPPLPAFSIKPPGSKFTFANATYAPLVLGSFKEEDDPAKFGAGTLAVERITFLSPSIGYQINDHWSVGASVGLSYQAVAVEDVNIRAPNELTGFSRLINQTICSPFAGESNYLVDTFLLGSCGIDESMGPFKSLAKANLVLEDNLSPSYNIGVLWEPNDKFAWGAVWQAEATANMTGKFKVEYANAVRDTLNATGSSASGQVLLTILGIPTQIDKVETAVVSLDLPFPAHFQTGIKYRFMPKWQLNFDIGYGDWAAWNEIEVDFDRPLTFLQAGRILSSDIQSQSIRVETGMTSSWSGGVGLQYDWNDRLKLRMGYEPRRNALPEDKRGLAPFGDIVLWGLGAGYQWDKDTVVDLSLSWMKSEDNIPANTSCYLNCLGLENAGKNAYAGLDVKTEFSLLVFGLAYRTKF